MSPVALVPPAEMVHSIEQAAEVLQYLDNRGHPIVAVDTETTGLVRHKDTVVFWSMSDGERRWCITRPLLGFFREYLENPFQHLIFQNINFDRAMLLNSGIDLHRYNRKAYRCFDTAVMHSLSFNNQPHDLKSLGWNLCNIKMVSFKDTFGKGTEKDTGRLLLEWFDKEPDRVASYASLDAYATFHVWKRLADYMSKEQLVYPGEDPSRLGENLLDYYMRIPMPMHDVLWQMERCGARVDLDYLKSKAPVLEKGMQEAEKELARVAGKVVNPQSSKQIVELFYKYKNGKWEDDNGNPPTKWTDGGTSGVKAPSVDAEVLEERAEAGCERSKLILKYRELAKLKSTYIDGLEERCDSNGYLHTSFGQHITDTGRLSSRDPNLQNIPRPDNDVARIRMAFIASEGCTLGDSDFGQLEMRIAASWSQDPNMIAPILAGRDAHCWTASTMYGCSYDELKEAYDVKESKGSLTPRQKELCLLRQRAKTTGFGVLYGKSKWGLAPELGITTDEAGEIIQRYFDGYPMLRDGYKRNISNGERYGFVRTRLGRRRQIPELSVKDIKRSIYNQGVRAANNFCIQGEAAEITAAAQIRIFEDDNFWSSGVRQTLQVHDEVIADIPKDVAADQNFVNQWEYYMTHPFAEFDILDPIPLVAKLGTGPNWLDAK